MQNLLDSTVSNAKLLGFYWPQWVWVMRDPSLDRRSLLRVALTSLAQIDASVHRAPSPAGLSSTAAAAAFRKNLRIYPTRHRDFQLYLIPHRARARPLRPATGTRKGFGGISALSC
jgi:hypothetical protein